MIEGLTELLDDYERGSCTLTGLYNGILSISNSYPINDVIDGLPQKWKGDFITWARQTFDNDVPADQFVIINNGIPAMDDIRPISNIREWLKDHVDHTDSRRETMNDI